MIVNDSAKTFRPSSMSQTYLLDGANKKKYTVARDEKKKGVCSATHDLAAKSTEEVWATFTRSRRMPGGVGLLDSSHCVA